MGENDTPEHRVAALQSRVSERLAALRRTTPEDAEYAEATEAVLAAATDLIDYEERLPALLDAEPHRLSVFIVRCSGLVVGVVGLALGIAALANWLPRWWLVPVAAVFFVTVALLRRPIPGPLKPHLALRPGAGLAAVGALVLALGAIAALGAGLVVQLWVAFIGLAVMLGGYWHQRRSVQVRPPAPVIMHRPRPLA
jgi:hypothetical protein